MIKERKGEKGDEEWFRWFIRAPTLSRACLLRVKAPLGVYMCSYV